MLTLDMVIVLCLLGVIVSGVVKTVLYIREKGEIKEKIPGGFIIKKQKC